MGIEDLDERNAYNTDDGVDKTQSSSLPGGCLLKVLGLGFLLYVALYFVMFKWLGELSTSREYYFEDHQLLYVKETELSDFTADLDFFAEFVYLVYNPLLNMDGARIELSEAEHLELMSVYQMHCAQHAQASVRYICAYERKNFVWFAEYGFWGFGEEWYVDLSP